MKYHSLPETGDDSGNVGGKVAWTETWSGALTGSNSIFNSCYNTKNSEWISGINVSYSYLRMYVLLTKCE